MLLFCWCGEVVDGRNFLLHWPDALSVDQKTQVFQLRKTELTFVQGQGEACFTEPFEDLLDSFKVR